MNTETVLFDEKQICTIAQKLAEKRKSCHIFTFEGPLGAGKTTLIKEMLFQAGVSQTVTSPTFTYLNVYENNAHELFYHFDLYRMGTLEEFLDAGFQEYLYAPNSWAIVEWPAIIMPLLKGKVCACTLDYNGISQREIQIQVT